jgi:hypothetical protein
MDLRTEPLEQMPPENINSQNLQCQGMDPMVIFTQTMDEMKTQREVDQRHYQADQCSHEERMQFEAR